jgi:hypothetical protein
VIVGFGVVGCVQKSGFGGLLALGNLKRRCGEVGYHAGAWEPGMLDSLASNMSYVVVEDRRAASSAAAEAAMAGPLADALRVDTKLV